MSLATVPETGSGQFHPLFSCEGLTVHTLPEPASVSFRITGVDLT